MESPAIPGTCVPGGPGQGPSREGLGPEALAFIIDLGICPGGICPRSREGCNPQCPALREWVSEVSGG